MGTLEGADLYTEQNDRDAKGPVKRTFGGAALAIALIAASSAGAQHLTAEPMLETVQPDTSSILLTSNPASARKPSFSQTSGLRVMQSYGQQDGSSAVRGSLVGNMPIADTLEAGVGLFSVAGDRRKHNEFRHNWSVKEVTPKRENIAAVGVRFEF